MTAVIPAPVGPALRLPVNPGMLARLKASPVLELLPSSGLMTVVPDSVFNMRHGSCGSGMLQAGGMAASAA